MSSAELAHVMTMLRSRPFDRSAREHDLRAAIDRLAGIFKPIEGVTISAASLAGVHAERHSAGEGGPVVLFLHGGGYVMGSSTSHRHLASFLAHRTGGEVYALDYRLAPEFPFPAAVDDASVALRDLALTHKDSKIALVGDSAGAGLAFTAALAVLRQPSVELGAVVGLSPWVNLGHEDDTYDRLRGLDPLLSREVTDYFASRYLAGAPRDHPAASPLFADLRGLPPVLIQVGDRECFFGDAARLHLALIAAGVDSELSVWKAMFHVWQLYWPILSEGRAALEMAAAFIVRHSGAA